MIYDYFLLETFKDSNDENFHKWKQEKKSQDKNAEELYILFLQEMLSESKEKSQRKKREQDNLKKVINKFYPTDEDAKKLSGDSVLIKIDFTLKKPYTSKDEGEFHIMNGRIIENPIIRDKFTGLPMVKPTTWKGHLRFAAERMNGYENKQEIIKRLFGSEPEDQEALKGRLYFFPTFFDEDAERDVITPLKRDTRTPAWGPIPLEVMKSGKKGTFYLLYVPYPKGKNFKEEQVEQDRKFIAKALKLMFYTYGFSAKRTSGFGIIEEKVDGIVYTKEKLEKFSCLEELVQKMEQMVRGVKYE